jgi:hypothetical protein
MVKELTIKEEKINVKEKLEKGWLDVVSIIEIAGKPASHLKEVMKKVIEEELMKNPGIKLIYHKIHEPKSVEETPNIFSTFTEIEFLAEDVGKVIGFVFDYMPASVEIVAPKDLSLNMNDANSLINDLAAKMHKYDAYVKNLAAQNMMMRDEFLKILAAAKEKKESDKNEQEDKKEK